VSASSNDDSLRPNFTIADDNRVCIFETCDTGDVINFVFVQVARIDVVQALDIGISSRLKGRPVMPVNIDIKTVVRGMREMMRMISRVPHHFFWNTAHIHAGSAKSPRFNYSSARAKVGRTLRMRETAATPTEHKQIIFSVHIFSQYFSESYPSGPAGNV